VPEYVPDRGEIVWLQFTPQAGHEPAGQRPALVISPKAYNRRSGLALVCPITSQVKGYPFEVELPPGIKAKGAVLCDQLRSLDWRARRAEKLCPTPSEVIEEATAKILALIDPS
jgi:mRNA interferase MazF